MAKYSKQIKINIQNLPVNENVWTITPSFNEEEVQAEFKAIIESRLDHCSTKLLLNLSTATVTDCRNIVFFKGEHFSMPVYEALEEALGQDMRRWSSLVWQQILRQMFEDNNRNFLLHQIATEGCLCGAQR